MRPPHLIRHADIIELDVQELIYAFEGALDAEVVFEFDGYGLVD